MKRYALLLTLLLVLSGCALSTSTATTISTTSTAVSGSTLTGTTTVLDYAGFDHLGGYDEIFDRSQATYIVYLYSLTCHNCSAIKQDVFAFATNHTLHPIYFLNVDLVGSDGRAEYLARTGQLSIGVPCMVLVSEQGTFDPEMTGQHLARGSAAVLELIALIEAGNVPNWN